jgi:hypothetical protein
MTLEDVVSKLEFDNSTLAVKVQEREIELLQTEQAHTLAIHKLRHRSEGSPNGATFRLSFSRCFHPHSTITLHSITCPNSPCRCLSRVQELVH